MWVLQQKIQSLGGAYKKNVVNLPKYKRTSKITNK